MQIRRIPLCLLLPGRISGRPHFSMSNLWTSTHRLLTTTLLLTSLVFGMVEAVADDATRLGNHTIERVSVLSYRTTTTWGCRTSGLFFATALRSIDTFHCNIYLDQFKLCGCNSSNQIPFYRLYNSERTAYMPHILTRIYKTGSSTSTLFENVFSLLLS